MKVPRPTIRLSEIDGKTTAEMTKEEMKNLLNWRAII